MEKQIFLNMSSRIFETVERRPASKLTKLKTTPPAENLRPPPVTGRLVAVLTDPPRLMTSFNRERSNRGRFGESGLIGSPTDRGDPVSWSEIRPPEEPVFKRRNPLRTQSTPTFKSLPGNIHHVDFKRHLKTANIRDCHVPTPKGGGVLGLLSRQKSVILGLMSRLSSFVRYRSSKKLDAEMLNRFTQEVGIVSSRVDLWRQKLLEECSTVSYPGSVDYSTREASFNAEFWAFIWREIQHLVQLTTDLATSIFGTLTTGLSEIEDNLFVLLQMGSGIIYPAVDFLVNSIWRLLREWVDLWREDRGKSSALRLAIESLINVLIAIQSLIHLGYAYQNMCEPFDREYTVKDLGGLVARPTPENMSNEVNKQQD